jgi:CRISPR-associated endonuclease/helicase Cas3
VGDLQLGDFRHFFFELHEKLPFPWQESLAEKVCTSDWPEVIDLPTASGKTACIDIALFALALRGPAVPRRIFFVVDRRIVVNEAYLRMRKIQCKLKDSEGAVVSAVAESLRKLGGGNDPLFVYEMRGGAFRDETWVRNPLQPTVVASTVDQVGSRLLFRGYGVNENTWPLHAGLIGNDALIILDEAHCSRAFAQTLQRVEQYRGKSWASHPMGTPFRFVEMTATPSRPRTETQSFAITSEDRLNETLSERLLASKPTRLIEVTGRKDDFGKLAEELVSQAISLAEKAQAKHAVIFVNRVRTAKLVHKRLQQLSKKAVVELVIGRMRAVDREDLYESKLKKLKSGLERSVDAPLTFVVSTQCLEVGADFDFDVLVSECASIDALQQRFGRLDRMGNFGRALAAVVMGSWQINPKQPDPVYGEALSKTWEWLKSIGGEIAEVNMGIESREGEQQTVAERLRSADSKELRLFGEDAPILLPAHVDAFAQTSPVPDCDPAVELFLHGPKRGVPDVQVLWRADLSDAKREDWKEIVELCPPSSRETMPVQIYAFKKWFAGEKNAGDKESDLPVGIEEDEHRENGPLYALVWQGDKTDSPINDPNKIRPGQTIVLPTSAGGWNELGYIPEDRPIDVADRAAFGARNSVSLRLHPEVMKKWPQTPSLQTVVEYASQDGAELKEIQERLRTYLTELDGVSWPHDFISRLDKLSRKRLSAYPGKRTSYVLEARRNVRAHQGSDPVFLDEHLADVESATGDLAMGLAADLQDALTGMAQLHDYGKVDVRYQAWLRGGDAMAARYAPKPIAKSGNDPLGKQESVGLPKGFRHELLSLMFAERSDRLNADAKDLMLHLIASHHGRCRPFAPVILDERAECVSYAGISICKEDRVEKAPHRLDSGVADRFWRLTGKYGWWGLAYLEALFRLADWRASEQEAAEASDD